MSGWCTRTHLRCPSARDSGSGRSAGRVAGSRDAARCASCSSTGRMGASRVRLLPVCWLSSERSERVETYVLNAGLCLVRRWSRSAGCVAGSRDAARCASCSSTGRIGASRVARLLLDRQGGAARCRGSGGRGGRGPGADLDQRACEVVRSGRCAPLRAPPSQR
jgi:hypothetical protein